MILINLISWFILKVLNSLNDPKLIFLKVLITLNELKSNNNKWIIQLWFVTNLEKAINLSVSAFQLLVNVVSGQVVGYLDWTTGLPGPKKIKWQPCWTTTIKWWLVWVVSVLILKIWKNSRNLFTTTLTSRIFRYVWRKIIS